MNLRNLSDESLLQSTLQTAKSEQAAKALLLRHLQEVERRRLYSLHHCSSLFAYCVKVLKYSDPEAGRRVSASRLLADHPKVEAKINSGELSLTSAAQVQTFFKREAVAHQAIAPAVQEKILSAVEGKSVQEVDKILLSYSSRPTSHRKECVRAVGEDCFELRLTIDKQTFAKMQRLKEIWSHQSKQHKYAEVLQKMAQHCVEKFDPLQPQEFRPPKQRSATPLRELHSGKRSRHIPTAVRREVWRRDQGECTYVDAKTSAKCASRYQLQLDHIQPFSLGGAHTADNLRLRCFAHNQRHAVDVFGPRIMRYLQQT